MITYKGKKYQCRDLSVVDEDGKVFSITFSTKQLYRKLRNKYEKCIDDEAERIDSNLYSYVEGRAFSLGEKSWAKHIWENVDLGGLKPLNLQGEL